MSGCHKNAEHFLPSWTLLCSGNNKTNCYTMSVVPVWLQQLQGWCLGGLVSGQTVWFNSRGPASHYARGDVRDGMPLQPSPDHEVLAPVNATLASRKDKQETLHSGQHGTGSGGQHQ